MISRRNFLKLTPAALLPALGGCGLLRIDPWHVLVRSPVITSLEEEKQILAKARLEWSDDERIRVLYVSGTPYERGYQHGVLLRKEVQDNIGYLWDKAVDVLHFEELFAEVYERMRPHIPQEYVEEMHGLAHGARMPLDVVHYVHILPSIGEWSGRRRIGKLIKKMISGELGTSCSNLGLSGPATADGNLYAVRILDWGLHRISKLHKYPLLTVCVPDRGYAFCNIGWVGFLGAVSGMNEQGITLGEMGYGDPPFETLNGRPMPFMLRDVMTYAKNLAEVRNIISTAPPTASFAYLMTDGKTGDAELYVRDPRRFQTYLPNQDLYDRPLDKHGNIKDEFFPARAGAVYGGHYGEVMAQVLGDYGGSITPELLMNELIPKMVMESNFQNVVYDPRNLQFWVNNAKSASVSAAREPYTHFEFGSKLAQYRGELNNRNQQQS